MIHKITQSKRFLYEWIIFNIIGFVIGSLLGATDYSLIASILDTSFVSRVIGDIVFSGCIGLMQYLALRRHFPKSRERLIWWIPVSIVAFTVGARLGARFAPMVTTEEIPLGIIFGIFLGGSFGLIHWIAMRVIGTLKARKPIVWIFACIVAWILAEIIGFGFAFNQLAMPLIALAIAIVTGVALIVWIEPE